MKQQIGVSFLFMNHTLAVAIYMCDYSLVLLGTTWKKSGVALITMETRRTIKWPILNEPGVNAYYPIWKYMMDVKLIFYITIISTTNLITTPWHDFIFSTSQIPIVRSSNWMGNF